MQNSLYRIYNIGFNINEKTLKWLVNEGYLAKNRVLKYFNSLSWNKPYFHVLYTTCCVGRLGSISVSGSQGFSVA